MSRPPRGSRVSSCIVGWALLAVALALPAAARAATLPDGFTETRIAEGLDVLAMAVAPDGRLFIAEKAGRVRVVKDDALLATPFATLPGIDASNERGLLGIALAPDFAASGHVYVLYTATAPSVHHRVSRFTAMGDVAGGAETVIFELDPVGAAGVHNAGAIHFGADGCLYIATGDSGVAANAQDLGTLHGKLLRIHADGSIPADNPFVGVASGANRAIWALGLRNPFTFAVHPVSGRMFINDVGGGNWEEINEGVAGANYGHPTASGMTSDPAFRSPLHVYGKDQGRAICGGAFYAPSASQFPAAYAGRYFFADFGTPMNGWIRTFDPATGMVEDFAGGVDRPIDLQVGVDGSLYCLVHSGIGDGSLADTTATANGAVVRIQYTGAQAAAIAIGAQDLFPGRSFTGIGGNYAVGRFAGSASANDAVGVASFATFAPDSARIGIPLQGWEPANDDGDTAHLAWNGFSDAGGVRNVFLLARDLQARGLPVIASIWDVPGWMVVDADQDTGRRLAPGMDDELIESITAFLLRARDQHGVTIAHLSFNEANSGFNLLLTAAEQAALIAKAGPRLAALGLHPTWLIGDTHDAASLLPYAAAILADAGARPFLGPLAFHAWNHGATDADHHAIAAFAAERGLPVWCTEVGWDSQAHLQTPPPWATWAHAWRLGQAAHRAVALAGASSLHLWSYQDDYPLADAVGPFPSGWVVKQLADHLQPGALLLQTTCSDPALLVLAARHPATGAFMVQMINTRPGAATADLSGLPAIVLNQLRSSETERMAAIGSTTIVDGTLGLELPARSITTLVGTVAPGIANAAPVVQAGADLTVLQTAAVTLAGSVADDGLPAPAALSSEWTQVGGPASIAFAAAASPTTGVTFPGPGSYVLRLAATDGELVADDEVTVTVIATPPSAATLRINFQPATAPVPAGYLVDSGAAFAAHGNGSTYGWGQELDGAFDRDSTLSPDQRYDTGIAMKKEGHPGGTWEIGLPNGGYRVHVVAGDAQFKKKSRFVMRLEGAVVLDGVPSETARWLDATADVTVADGRLTLTSGADAKRNDLCFIEIAPLGAAPATVACAAGASTVAEGGGTVGIILVLDRPLGEAVQVGYAITGGTATIGSDVQPLSGIATFAPGQTTVTIPIAILQDALDEDDETLVVGLSSPQGAVLGAPAAHTVTIVDDDLPPRAAFASPLLAIGEGAGAIAVGVVLDAPSGRTVDLSYAIVGGTASVGPDVDAAAGVLSFAPGATTASIPLTLRQDALDEHVETVRLALHDPALVDLCEVAIADDDAPATVGFALVASDAAEAGGSHVLTVTVEPASGKAIGLAVAVGGSATPAFDHGLSAGTLVIPAGATTATIAVPILEDGLDEDAETVLASLSLAPGTTVEDAALNGTAHAVTIIDDDAAPIVAFLVDVSQVGESAPSAQVDVRLGAASGRTVTVAYTVGGTATPPGPGADHGLAPGQLVFAPGQVLQSLHVPLIGDQVDETDETVVIGLAPVDGAQPAEPSTHVLTIIDDDQAAGPSVAFAAGASDASEGDGAIVAGVALAAPAPSLVRVSYAITGGSAAIGSDVSGGNGVLEILAGDTTGSIALTVLADELSEGDETVELTLSAPEGATLGAPSTHVLTIHDDDQPAVAFGVSAFAGDESVADVRIPVVLTRTSSGPVTVGYRVIDGSATLADPVTTGEADAWLAAGTLTIEAGESAADLVLAVVADGRVEGDETVVIELHDAQGAALGVEAIVTYTIRNDDLPAPAVRYLTTSIDGAVVHGLVPDGLGIDTLLVDGGAGGAVDGTLFTATIASGGAGTRGIDLAFRDRHGHVGPVTRVDLVFTAGGSSGDPQGLPPGVPDVTLEILPSSLTGEREGELADGTPAKFSNLAQVQVRVEASTSSYASIASLTLISSDGQVLTAFGASHVFTLETAADALHELTAQAIAEHDGLTAGGDSGEAQTLLVDRTPPQLRFVLRPDYRPEGTDPEAPAPALRHALSEDRDLVLLNANPAGDNATLRASRGMNVFDAAGFTADAEVIDVSGLRGNGFEQRALARADATTPLTVTVDTPAEESDPQLVHIGGFASLPDSMRFYESSSSFQYVESYRGRYALRVEFEDRCGNQLHADQFRLWVDTQKPRAALGVLLLGGAEFSIANNDSTEMRTARYVLSSFDTSEAFQDSEGEARRLPRLLPAAGRLPESASSPRLATWLLKDPVDVPPNTVRTASLVLRDFAGNRAASLSIQARRTILDVGGFDFNEDDKYPLFGGYGGGTFDEQPIARLVAPQQDAQSWRIDWGTPFEQPLSSPEGLRDAWRRVEDNQVAEIGVDVAADGGTRYSPFAVTPLDAGDDGEQRKATPAILTIPASWVAAPPSVPVRVRDSGIGAVRSGSAVTAFLGVDTRRPGSLFGERDWVMATAGPGSDAISANLPLKRTSGGVSASDPGLARVSYSVDPTRSADSSTDPTTNYPTYASNTGFRWVNLIRLSPDIVVSGARATVRIEAGFLGADFKLADFDPLGDYVRFVSAGDDVTQPAAGFDPEALPSTRATVIAIAAQRLVVEGANASLAQVLELDLEIGPEVEAGLVDVDVTLGEVRAFTDSLSAANNAGATAGAHRMRQAFKVYRLGFMIPGEDGDAIIAKRMPSSQAQPTVSLDSLSVGDVTVSGGNATLTLSGEIRDPIADNAPRGSVAGGFADLEEVRILVDGVQVASAPVEAGDDGEVTYWRQHPYLGTFSKSITFPARDTRRITVVTSRNAVGRVGHAAVDVGFAMRPAGVIGADHLIEVFRFAFTQPDPAALLAGVFHLPGDALGIAVAEVQPGTGVLFGERDGRTLRVILDQYTGPSEAITTLDLVAGWDRGDGAIFSLPIIAGAFGEDQLVPDRFTRQRAVALQAGGMVAQTDSVTAVPSPEPAPFTPIALFFDPGSDPTSGWKATLQGQGPFGLEEKDDGLLYLKGPSRGIGSLVVKEGKTYFVGFIAPPGGAVSKVEILIPDPLAVSAAVSDSLGLKAGATATVAAVELLVDTSRLDGLTAADAADKNSPIAYAPMNGRGAMLLPNADDDLSRTAEDAAVSDSDDAVINGDDDFLDLEMIRLRKLDVAPTATVDARLEFVDIGDNDLYPRDQRVRVFGSQLSALDSGFVASATMVIGKGKPVSDNLASWLVGKGDYHLLAIEGVVPGMEAALRLTVTVTESGVNGGAPLKTVDQVRVRVCPFLPIPATEPIRKLIKPMTFGALNPLPVWGDFMTLFGSTPDLQPLLAPDVITTIAPNWAFAQDQAEFGYAYMPLRGNGMRIALGFPRSHDVALPRLGRFVGPGRGTWSDGRWKSGGYGDRGAMGGNLEVTPKIPGYPFGITLMADTEVNPKKLFTRFMKAQEVQSGSLLLMDFSGLPSLAHIDEVVSIIPSAGDFAVLVADLDQTMAVFAANPTVRLSVDETFGTLLEKFRPGGADGAELKAMKASLAAVRSRLEGILGPARVIGFPSLPGNGITTSIPNAINLVVLRGSGSTHLAVPDPRKAELRDAMRVVLAAPALGYSADRVHFIDTRALSSAGGELHCATNAERAIPPLP